MQNPPSPSCSDQVSVNDSNRSDTTIIQSHIDLKSWQARFPSVDEVRPHRCPKCGAPSRPVGAPIVIHGHGLRDRQVRGPSAPDAPPTMVVIMARRYLCTACGTVPVVVPREVRARRLYSVSAMALALALWGLVKMPSRVVRERVNPARIVAEPTLGWVTVCTAARASFTDIAASGARAISVAAASLESTRAAFLCRSISVLCR